uniref:eIF4-gamma/eIF5/eIF2-epsilon domain-containing protein n=1 Tax=Arundo donax TaxID=35708 RepID=A0A0A9CTV9_ARUDO
MLYNHSHNSKWVLFPSVLMFLESVLQAHIADCITANKNEISAYHAALVYDTERVARADRVVRLDGRDGHAPSPGLPRPPSLLQVLLDLVRVRAAEDVGLVHPRRLQPRERVLDHRHVHQR